MMIPKEPIFDRRSEKDIFQNAAADLNKRMNLTVEEDPLANALLRVFARYCGLIIQRLNQVPHKNFMAFLDILNVSRIPPVPAQVPLTFTPVKTLPASASGIVVPVHTKVAASPGENETEAAVFETMFELSLTGIQLKKIVSVDPEFDRYTDRSSLAAVEKKGPDQFVFAGDQPISHVFYLGWSALETKNEITGLRVRFEIEPPTVSGCRFGNLEWFIPTQKEEVLLAPDEDTTNNLSQSGEIMFQNLPQWSSSGLFGHSLPWLGCRLPDPLQSENEDFSHSRFPMIKSVMITAQWKVDENTPTRAFFNNIPIDLSRDFFPFGIRPQFGDLFYLSWDFFAASGCELIMKIKMTNPSSGIVNSPVIPVNRNGNPGIRWEYWNGNQWTELICHDHTDAFTEDGQVSFIIPSDSKCTTVNGMEGAWIRARLISGNYGHEERYEFNNTDQRLHHIPSTLAPPCFQTVTLTSSFTAGPHSPDKVITNNHLTFKEIEGHRSFQPFYGSPEPYKSLCLGFRVPENIQQTWSDTPVNLYFHVSGTEGRAFVSNNNTRKQLMWQYWNGRDWINTGADDGTRALNRSGMIRISCGADSAPWNGCSIDDAFGLHWLRLLWISGEFECRPKIARILLNTVPATQTMTLENELLGSGSGKPFQMFRSSRTPILEDVNLMVREPDMPPEDELKRIYDQEGRDALEISRNLQGEIEKIRIRWHKVNDFVSSDNRDRHFVVDRQRGEIRFGDGQRGMIAPSGLNNVWLRSYRTGGGALGNKPAGSITQLRSSVPYVDSVVNPEPALGGQDMEDWDSVAARGGSMLRHRNRAVTTEDYEDLARLAAPDVAMARCYPNRNLAISSSDWTIKPGVISLIVVPRSRDPRPLPDLNLLVRVKEFIDHRRIPDPELIVLAPEYVQVCVEAVVVAGKAHRGNDLLAKCRLELDRYLHPLTGGDHGTGWGFGERPHESDLYGILQTIRGLEYIRTLDLRLKEDTPDLLKKGIFLISAGEHSLRLEI